MKQYLFFCDGDEGRFSFLKLLAKSCNLQLDRSGEKQVKINADQDQDVYRFRGHFENISFQLHHPLSSMDGLKKINTEAIACRAFILINIRKPKEKILDQLLSSAQLLGFQDILVMGYQTSGNDPVVLDWAKWMQNYCKKQEAAFSMQSRFSKIIFDASAFPSANPDNSSLVLHDFFSTENEIIFINQEEERFNTKKKESKPLQEIAEICWLGTSPLESGESLMLEIDQEKVPVTVSLALSQPKRIAYGESARILIRNCESDPTNAHSKIRLSKEQNPNQSFILKRNGIMIGRGRLIGVRELVS